MRFQLSARDRALLVFVLWPAMLLLVVTWLVSPLSASLASSRGRVAEREAELAAIQSGLARRSEIEGTYQAALAEHRRLTQRTVGAARVSEVTLALQRVVHQAGVSVESARLGDVEPARSRKGSRFQLQVIEVSARTDYRGLVRLLDKWASENPAARLTRVEVEREEEGGALRVRFLATVVVTAAPGSPRSSP